MCLAWGILCLEYCLYVWRKDLYVCCSVVGNHMFGVRNHMCGVGNIMFGVRSNVFGVRNTCLVLGIVCLT